MQEYQFACSNYYYILIVLKYNCIKIYFILIIKYFAMQFYIQYPVLPTFFFFVCIVSLIFIY